MSELPQPDAQFLLGAIGWIELGLPAEAHAELSRIAGTFQQHPDVLDVRWQVCAALEDWDQALAVAEALVTLAPQRVSGWIHRAYSLRRATGGGLLQSWEALLPACGKFPKNSIIPYNLACYTAQLGRLDEAWDWLQKAMAIAKTSKSIQQMALADEDLQPLWERLKKQ